MNPKQLKIVSFCLSLFINVTLLVFFYNRFWSAPDDGIFAHVAERVADGEVLNRDILESHPGYIHFVNAAMFGVFGRDLLSMRYPLLFVGILQSFLLFLIFWEKNVFSAVLAASAVTILGILQFLTPHPNWYCLFFLIVLTFVILKIPQENRWRLIICGFLIGVIYLFRQLSGVFVAMGLLTYLCIEKRKEEEQGNLWLGRLISMGILIGLLAYLIQKADLFGLILIGIWPLLALCFAVSNSSIGNRDFLKNIFNLFLGAFCACVPLLIYHLKHGSLAFWFHDTFYLAAAHFKQWFLYLPGYKDIFTQSVQNLFLNDRALQINGLYWIFSILLFALAGGMTIRFLFINRGPDKKAFLPLIFIFYAAVSLHNQIPIYLSFGLGTSMIVVLWISSDHFPPVFLRFCIFIAVFLYACGIYYHAGQPLSRRWEGIINGKRESQRFGGNALARNHLWVGANDLQIYAETVNLIKRESGAQEKIFVLPNSAELYFLSERKNPFRFADTFLGIRNEKDSQEVISVLKERPPRLVIFSPDDARNTVFSTLIMESVKANYYFMGKIGHFEIYKSF